MNKVKYIIAVHGYDEKKNKIDENNPKFVYSYNQQTDRLATTDNVYEAKVFNSEDECQDVIDDLMTISRTSKNNWVYSYHLKPV